MPERPPMPFQCPACGAAYKLIRIEVASAPDADLPCPACGAPLPSHEGALGLKYFMVQSGRRRRPVPSVAAPSL